MLSYSLVLVVATRSRSQIRKPFDFVVALGGFAVESSVFPLQPATTAPQIAAAPAVLGVAAVAATFAVVDSLQPPTVSDAAAAAAAIAAVVAWKIQQQVVAVGFVAVVAAAAPRAVNRVVVEVLTASCRTDSKLAGSCLASFDFGFRGICSVFESSAVDPRPSNPAFRSSRCRNLVSIEIRCFR